MEPQQQRKAVELVESGQAAGIRDAKKLMGPKPPLSKEAQIRALREHHAAPPISKAGAAFHAEHPAPPRPPDLDELKSVLAMLRGDPGRIANLSIEKRVALARACLAFLNLTVANLRDGAP
jgi:hypothetical protein